MTDENKPLLDVVAIGKTGAEGAPGFVNIPPQILEKWQAIVDTMAQLISVPAGLIMRASNGCIEVLVSSRTAGNPYHPGESDDLIDSGLYCETVISSGRSLLVPDALASPVWKDNPDVDRKMIAYLGFPIRWPDRRPFGTICVLDFKANAYSALYKHLVCQFRDIIEYHLQIISIDADRQAEIGRERGRYEDALRISEERLEALQNDLTRASRLSTMEEFAASVIHDVSQPLTAVVASAETSLRWLTPENPNLPEAREAIAHLIQDSRRAADIVASLRVWTGSGQVDRAQLDISQAIHEVLTLVHADLDRGAIELRLRLHSDTMLIPGNRIQLQQALMILVRNAIEAMEADDSRPRVLSVSSELRPSGLLLISVEDTGVGVAPEAMTKLFNPLFTTKGDAIGMGLAIGKSIAEAHGGRLQIGSGSDHGTKVELTLLRR